MCNGKKNQQRVEKGVRGFPGHPFLPVPPLFFLFSLDANFLKENNLDLFEFTKGSPKMFSIK